jgi:hypothetical protein
MAKRLNKITPIATSVALSLGLTGCFSDNDNNEKVVNPPQPISKEVTQTANFNVTVSGKAVKGILNGALVSVQTINDAGELEDVAYRTQPGEVSVTGKATTEEEAKQKANEALLADNPSELKTNAKGVYSIVVDESFSGPLHITVKATKDSDALVKCDAFVGCGQGQDIDGNNNGKIEFGEWYKDDVELSVVKLINKPSTSSSKSQPQFADGDNNQYRANVTVFTSTAAKILIKAASEKQIDSTDVSAASVKVLEALVGDTSLVAGLTGDISLGGAVDFTDVESEDTLDASTLTLIQVAASIQVVATKAGKSVDEVLQDLNSNLDQGSLEQSEVFTEVKKEAKSAGQILAAAVSGDDEALKKALVDAGVSEDEVEEAASSVKESKDKAVENSGTNEDDLKEDVEDVKDQLDNLGDDAEEKKNKALEAENTAVLAGLNSTNALFNIVSGTLDALSTDLAEVESLAVEDNNFVTKEAAIAYFAAANNLSELFKLQVETGSDSSESTTQIIATQSELVTSFKTRSEALVAEDNKYQTTLDIANTQSQRAESLLQRQDALKTGITANLELANEALEKFGSKLDGLKSAAETAVADAEQSKVTFDTEFATVKTTFDSVKKQVSEINSLESANTAIQALSSASKTASSTLEVATLFEQKAQSSKSTVDAFKAEADAQATEVDTAEALQEKVAELIEASSEGIKETQELIDELSSLSKEAAQKKSEYITAEENDKLNEDILSSIDKISERSSDEKAELSTYKSTLEEAKALGTNANTEAAVTAYYEAILKLSSEFNETTRDDLINRLDEYLTQARPVLDSAEALSDKNAKYDSTRLLAQDLVDSLDSGVQESMILFDDIQSELEKAKQKASEYDVLIEAAYRAASEAITATEDAISVVMNSKDSFNNEFDIADNAFVNRTDYTSIVDAISNIDLALESYDAYTSSTVEGLTKAESALALTETYLELVGESKLSVNATSSTNVPVPEAPIISLEYVQSLVDEAAKEKSLADADNRDQTLAASKSAAQSELVVLEETAKIAKEGTDKMVSVSFVTKEGASAVYDFGEVMLNVVKDIVDNGTFDTGKQSGTSGKYPDWSYSYDLNIDEKDLSFVFENTSDGQKVELLGTVTSGFKESTIVFTWSGNLITESGQKLVMPSNAESLEQCVFFAEGDSQFTDNASCLYIDLNKDIAVNNPDYSDLEVLKVSSFNVVEFVDSQYGFDGTVKFDIYGLDADGQAKGLFSSGDVIEHADFVVEGITEQTEFSAVFDVKYDDIHTDIGTFDVNLLNFNGYQFRLDLVSEVGPIVGEVSIYNDVEGKKAVAGAVREITNGFNIIYVDSQSIDYTDIDFLGKSN